MRVIKSGTTKTPWVRVVTCFSCKAELEVTKADCKLVYDQRDGDFWSTHCPECQSSVTIQASQVR